MHARGHRNGREPKPWVPGRKGQGRVGTPSDPDARPAIGLAPRTTFILGKQRLLGPLFLAVPFTNFWRIALRLHLEQQQTLRERYDVSANEVCDTCGKILAWLRFTRKVS